MNVNIKLRTLELLKVIPSITTRKHTDIFMASIEIKNVRQFRKIFERN